MLAEDKKSHISRVHRCCFYRKIPTSILETLRIWIEIMDRYMLSRIPSQTYMY